MDYTVIHDEKVNRFEIFESGQIAYLQYTQDRGVINMLHTFVPGILEGQGIGSALVKSALDYARDEGLKVIPTCSFIDVYIKRHKEYQDLVTQSSFAY